MAAEEVHRNRLRVRKACEICKRRKVKCDGNQPCGNCVKHGQECQYISGTLRRRHRRRDTSDSIGGTVRDGLFQGVTGDTDRMASLLVQLGGSPAGMAGILPPVGLDNERISANTSAIRHLITTTNSVGYNSQTSPWQSFSLDKYRFHRRYQNLLPFYLGASLMMEIPHDAIESHGLKQPRIQNYGWNMSGGHYLEHDSGSKTRAQERARVRGVSLEPEGFFDFDNPVHLSVVNKILKYFFENINPPLSIVHERVFWQQFNKKFLPDTKLRDSSGKLFQSMLFLILAITLRFKEGFEQSSEEPNGKSDEFMFTWEESSFFKRQHREEAMFKYAYRIVTQLTFEWESFELIQSWLLITFYFRTCYRQTACWNALGQAINMCNGMSLYLNRFPRTHSKYDESRAWHCFWASFIMDKLISFQMGRYYQLSMPVSHMTTPGHWGDNKVDVDRNGNNGVEDGGDSIWSDDGESTSDESGSESDGGDDLREGKDSEDDWFHSETTQLFELAVIIQSSQKRDGEELDLEESLALRRRLDDWFTKNVRSTRVDKNWARLYEIQPLLSYLDVRLTFETRRLFLLINQPLDTGEMIFPVDTLGLVKHCQLSIKILSEISRRRLYFIPWWLNLSQLFTTSVICITLIHSGLQASRSRNILGKCMDIWNSLVVSKPKNPPGMMPECLWCIKMLNHMCCLRLITSATHLENLVGTNPGDPTPNDNKFSQFGKVGETAKVLNSDEESGHAPVRQDSQSQQIQTKNESGANNGVIKSDTVDPFRENQFKISPRTRQSNLNDSMLGRGPGLVNTPRPPQDLENSGMYNIPSSSVTDSSAAGNNTETHEAIDEGFFSYLQWFDRNFM